MTLIIPYITLKGVGSANEAIRLYQSVFGAKLVEQMSYTPELGQQYGFPDNFDYKKSTMHAKIEIEGASMFISDELDFLQEKPLKKGLGKVEIYIELDSKAKYDEIWENASKRPDFKVLAESEFSFWGSWFARFMDSNEIAWQISYTPPAK